MDAVRQAGPQPRWPDLFAASRTDMTDRVHGFLYVDAVHAEEPPD